jgi:hypothetical protein
MRILPRKAPDQEVIPGEIDPATERRTHRRIEVTVEREVLSILVRRPAAMNADESEKDDR